MPKHFKIVTKIILFADDAECAIGHSACDSVHQCDGSTALIASANYPSHYFKTRKCTWKILSPEGTYISASFITFDLPSWGNCESTYIDFYDGLTDKYDLLGSFCNNHQPPAKLISSFNEMFVRFQSGQEEPGTGFLFQYKGEVLQRENTTGIQTTGKVT